MRTRNVLEDERPPNDDPPTSGLAASNELAAITHLRAVLTGLAGTDLTLLPDPVVRDNLLALVSITNQLNAVVWAHLGVFDNRGLSVMDAFKHTTGWLKAFGRILPHTGGAHLKRAAALQSLPALAAACGRGEVGADSVDRIVELIKDVGVATVKANDQILADLAASTTADEVKRACNQVRGHADPDGPEPKPDKDWEKRDLSIGRNGNHVTVKGRLDLESGSALITAIDAQLRPPGQEDLRTPGQRRADAFAEIILSVLNHGCLPSVRGRKPSVGVLVRPSALLRPPVGPLTHEEKVAAFLRQYGEDLHRDNLPGCTANQPTTDTTPGAGNEPGPFGNGRQPGTEQPEPDRSEPDWSEPDRSEPDRSGPGSRPGTGPGETSAWDPVTAAGFPPLPEGGWMDWVGDVPIETVRRLACDCSVWRALLDPLTGLPLDVGRERRTAPEWMLRALHARDRTCRWPGCDAPAQWTDAHHMDEWWRDGGETTIEKMISLCRWHHVTVHEGHWRITLDTHTGEVRVFRPDGRPYELGPTQPWTAATSRGAG